MGRGGEGPTGWLWSSMVLGLAALGCGRHGYDPLASDGAPVLADARFDASTDAAQARAPCDWSDGPPSLEQPVAMSALDTADGEVDPALSAGGLVLHYLVVTDPLSMRRSERGAVDAPFPAGDVVDLGIAPAGSLRLSADGLAAVLQVDGGPGALGEIYLASREAIDEPLGAFAPVVEVNGPSDELDPFLTSDRLQLWLVSDRGGVQEIHVATRASDQDPFSTPVRVDALRGDPAVADGNPTLTDDQRTIIFASDGQLWTASRASAAASFGAPVPITAVDTANFEWEPAIRGDGCQLVFGRMAADGWHLYTTEVP